MKFKFNTQVGKKISLDELRQNFKAILISIGAQTSSKLDVSGERLDGVYGAIEFLRDANLGKKVKVGKRVVVIGGGNAAVDAARTSIRLGGEEVSIVYRRSRAEMLAIEKEVEEAEVEGVRIRFLTNPTRIIGENGKVTGMECISMKLGGLDWGGRRRPIPISGSEFELDVDTVIVAVGQTPDSSFLEGHGLSLNRDETFQVNILTLQTNIDGIFAGGDVVTGPKTVIDALAAGRKAAISIDRYIKGKDLNFGREGEGTQESKMVIDVTGIITKARIAMLVLPLDQRKRNFQEVDLGLGKREAIEEAERCLACECKVCVENCEFLKKFCGTPKELAEKFRGGYFREKPQVPYSCNLCNLCERLCPEDLNVGKMCLELRGQLVEEGLGPLLGHKFVKMNQEWVLSDQFMFSLPDLRVSKCERIFFSWLQLIRLFSSISH